MNEAEVSLEEITGLLNNMQIEDITTKLKIINDIFTNAFDTGEFNNIANINGIKKNFLEIKKKIDQNKIENKEINALLSIIGQKIEIYSNNLDLGHIYLHLKIIIFILVSYSVVIVAIMLLFICYVITN